MPFVPSIADMGSRACYTGARNLEECFRFLLAGSQAAIGPGHISLITGEPHPFGNFGVVSDATDLESAKLVADPLSKCDAPALVGFHEDPSREIAEMLKGYGFDDPEPMPVMGIELDRLPKTHLPDGYEFRIAGREDAEAWTAAVVEAFALPKPIAELLSPHRTPPNNDFEQAHFLGVFHGDKAVATAGLYLNGEIAGIYSVGTIPEERGKGIGAHITSESFRMAMGMRYKVGVLQASTTGYPVYKRIGFQDLGTAPLYFRNLQDRG